MTLRVAHLNVQSGIATTQGYYQYVLFAGKYFFRHHSKSIAELARYACEESFDILCTTEIDAGSNRTGFVDQCALLAEISHLKNYAFFSTFKRRKRLNQGNAIHTRYDTGKQQNILLPGRSEPRYVSKLLINYRGVMIAVLVTHLSLKKKYRTEQLRRLVSILDTIKEPAILLGDFNIRKKSEMLLLDNSRLTSVIDKKTYPSWNPRYSLDHIYTSEEFVLIDSDVHKKRFSDHLLCSADIELKEFAKSEQRK